MYINHSLINLFIDSSIFVMIHHDLYTAIVQSASLIVACLFVCLFVCMFVLRYMHCTHTTAHSTVLSSILTAWLKAQAGLKDRA